MTRWNYDATRGERRQDLSATGGQHMKEPASSGARGPYGGDERIRTAGLCLAKAALSQLSYIPFSTFTSPGELVPFSTDTSETILPTTLTGLAGTISSSLLAGVGP